MQPSTCSVASSSPSSATTVSGNSSQTSPCSTSRTVSTEPGANLTGSAAMSVRCWAPSKVIADAGVRRGAGVVDVGAGGDDGEHPAAGGDQVAVATRRAGVDHVDAVHASAASTPVITSPDDDDSG